MRTAFAFALLGLLLLPAQSEEPFVIQVVDAVTKRGVPLVELRTVHQSRYLTDSAGRVAVDDPELFGQEIYFFVNSHGYEMPEDGFGFRGVRLAVASNTEATIKLPRINLAERLYRITGAGIYDHSIRAKQETPLAQPLLNGQVFGCDSVLTTIWKGKLFWIWGDTNRPNYPLGNFQTTGAVSDLPESGGLDPDLGIDFHYFMGDKGFVKGVANMPGEGPTWLSGLAVLPDAKGEEHLVAHFVKVKGFLDVYRRGLCEWDEAVQEFREVLVFPKSQKLTPEGHPFPETIDGKPYLTYADPLPTLRIPANYEAWKDPKLYQAVSTKETFRDVDSGTRVKPHRGSVYWNGHRQCWIMIFTEIAGRSSELGEVWYAEASSPTGPWEKCVRIVTHDRYSFYNPKQHPYFAKSDGRYLYFEGTYTATFSGNSDKTPKYDYNQMMYRLDLDDARLMPARVE